TAGDQLAHVAHRRAVAERQPDLRLESLASREVVRPSRLSKVVRNRLLAQHVLAGFERRPGQLEMRVARGTDVDGVDVVAIDYAARVRDGVWDRELARRLTRAIDLRVGDRDDRAAWIGSVS